MCSGGVVHACSLQKPPNIVGKYISADVILIAKLTSVGKTEENYPFSYKERFELSEKISIKSSFFKKKYIETTGGLNACGTPYIEDGQKYLIYATYGNDGNTLLPTYWTTKYSKTGSAKTIILLYTIKYLFYAVGLLLFFILLYFLVYKYQKKHN